MQPDDPTRPFDHDREPGAATPPPARIGSYRIWGRWAKGGSHREVASEMLVIRKHATEAEDADADAWVEYARLLLTVKPEDLRDTSAANAAARAAAEQSPDDPAILRTLAEAQFANGDAAAAAETVRKALAVTPEDATELRGALEAERYAAEAGGH